nr:MAG TPA: hypothetical protein [Caudoviricetes sp.]
MSTIRIFSKKAFAFGPGAQHGTDVIDHFITVPGTFQDMPEHYQNDLTFKEACKCGEVEVVRVNAHSVVPETKVEVNAEDETETSTDENEVDIEAEVKKFYEDLKTKSATETKELAKKYGADFVEDDQLKINKKRVLEAYKISLTENK